MLSENLINNAMRRRVWNLVVLSLNGNWMYVITTDWHKKNQMFLHSSLLTLGWAKLLNLFNLSKFRDSLEIAQQLLWQQWKCCEKWSSPSKSTTKNIQKTLWYWKWQKRKRIVDVKIWAKENCWRLCTSKRYLLMQKYELKRIVDANISAKENFWRLCIRRQGGGMFT